MRGAGIQLLVVIFHLIAVITFINGFLLRRAHLPEHNTNTSLPCAKPYKKLVWVVIDALRYDFVVHDARYPCTMDQGCDAWRGQMPFLSSMLHQTESARVVRYVAEAPTTTTQRLKSMVAGTLPTFFDISNTFTAGALEDDNLIAQFQRAGKSLAFMGDITWPQLFPGSFNISKPFPCFNVKDLHTVDDGIWEHLIPVIKEPHAWDVLIAHFLGVDHAGHTYGVASQEMGAKLQQLDEYVATVAETLAHGAHPGGPFEDTLLLVVGDHGQTLGGDHGGGSPEEVDSVLVALDVATWRHQGMKRQPSSMTPTPSTSGSREGSVPAVTQIDVVPTLAVMMGVPLPYGNLGMVAPHLLALAARCGAQSKATLAAALKENVEQVVSYLHAYSQSSGGGVPKASLNMLNGMYSSLPPLSNATTDMEGWTDQCLELLQAANTVAHKTWTQFGNTSMVIGLSLFLATTVALVLVLVSRAGAAGGGTKAGAAGGTKAGGGGLVLVPLNAGTVGLIAAVLATVIHSIGIFSFNFLLTEGKMVSQVMLATAVTMTVTALLHSKKKVTPSSSTILIACTAAVLASTVASSMGLVQHTGYGFWQRLTHHGPGEGDDQPEGGQQQTALHMHMFELLRQRVSALWDMHARLSSFELWLVKVVLHVCPTAILALLTGRRAKVPSSVKLLLHVAFLLATLHQLLPTVEKGLMGSADKDQRLTLSSLLPSHVQLYWLKIPALALSPLVNIPLLLLLPRILFALCTLSSFYIIPYIFISSSPVATKVAALQFLVLPLVLILSRGHVAMVGLMTVAQAGALGTLIRANRAGKGRTALKYIAAGCLLVELQSQTFFLTGHACEFAGLNYTAGFVGYEEFDLYRSGALLALETLAGIIMVAVEAPTLLVSLSSSQSSEHVVTGLLALVCGRTLLALTAMMSAVVQRRHLYAWALFAPRFAFEVVFLMVTDAVVLVLLFAMRSC